MSFLLQVLFISAFLFSHNTWAVQEAELYLNATATSSAAAARKLAGSCNVYQGKWVFDASYPLYDFSTCPFLDDEFNCLKHKRPDTNYLKYRWQPSSCNLPRFNGVNFLEKWRGKKVMFVGDSLSLNMWQSLSCMLHSAVPQAKTSMTKTNGITGLTFLDYNFQLLLYRTPYLVDIESQKVGRVLKLNSMQSGNSWKGMDMLIFNSWHWWTHTGSSQGWDYMEDGGKLVKDMDRLIAFYKGLTTWARWVDKNVDPSKTKVFFQGISPTHYQGKDWSAPSKSCKDETQPFFGVKYPGGTLSAALVVNKVLTRIKKPVQLLDITLLSQYRKDAHPVVYGQQSSLDCSHWCLPGLPDTWNLLLYTALFT